LAANVAQGKAGEAATRAKLGLEIAGEQITIITSTGVRTRVDFLKQGIKEILETKTGNAKLSPGQVQLADDILAGRLVTPVGKNAQKAGLEPGKQVKFDKFNVDPQ
jgi:hypothetical protein